MTGAVDACIVFKPVHTIGGLERYVAELASVIDAPVYTPREATALPRSTSGDSPEVIEFGEVDWFRRVLDRLPVGAVTDVLEYEALEIPDRYDVVVTASETAKAVIHQPHQRRIHLLNMPPRWLFDLRSERYGDAVPPVRWLVRLYQSAVRVHDATTVSRIGEFVVPSEIIGRRLATYYGRSADRVIHPPVPVDDYRGGPNQGYLLYVGRLTPMKRVVELVEALSGTDHRLKIAGTGPEAEAVSDAAGSNVDVLGYVSESRKRELLANCDAFVLNSSREAFGIAPVEAMASGKPVVGVDEGFTSHQVTEGENGVLFSRGARNLRRAVERMYRQAWDPDVIKNSSSRYDVSSFRREWRDLVLRVSCE